MLKVTHEAGARLANLLSESHAPEGTAVRFVPGGCGLEITMDNERLGDKTFDYGGTVVLVLDPELWSELADAELGVEDSPEGPSLRLYG